jgi:glycosyltransferase involved in cell wall biosynthesis
MALVCVFAGPMGCEPINSSVNISKWEAMADRPLLPISLVIPVRNEASTLDELFAGLQALSPKSSEIIFVETGSVDGSPEKIKAWGDVLEQSAGTRCRLIQLAGGLPGAARNLGVCHATHDWIAFIDAGIVPHIDWLGELWNCSRRTGADVTYGMCRFTSDHMLGRMICAASSGYARVQPVLPASLFRKALFAQHGGFQEALRSGEDVLWMRILKKAGVRSSVCGSAVVEYRHFPEAMAPALKKWFIYEQSAVVAQVGKSPRAVFHVGLMLLYSLVWFEPGLLFPMVLVYMFLRGIVDPLRRSGWIIWWSSWIQFLLMPIMAALMDLSSALGRLSAWLGMSNFRRT